jgi:hypothetical protein
LLLDQCGTRGRHDYAGQHCAGGVFDNSRNTRFLRVRDPNQEKEIRNYGRGNTGGTCSNHRSPFERETFLDEGQMFLTMGTILIEISYVNGIH